VLGAAQADPFRAVLAGGAGVERRLGVGADGDAVGGVTLKAGDRITIDGSNGQVMQGSVEMVESRARPSRPNPASPGRSSRRW
jgi:hypothetical protein